MAAIKKAAKLVKEVRKMAEPADASPPAMRSLVGSSWGCART
jgi:hypothetical protein